MSRKVPALAAVGLGLSGLLGLAVLALGEASPLDSVLQQYETQTKKKVDRAKADDLYAWAKWCFQNGLSADAMTVAMEAHQKAPEDVRVKYLLYAIENEGGGGGETGAGEGSGKPVVATISDSEAEGVFKTEGDKALNAFREIQSMLIMRCGSLKCHGSQSEKKYGLVRQNLQSRKTMAENFRAINRYIVRDKDKDKAAQSRLLQMPLKAPDNGHPKDALRGTSDPVFIKTRDWITTLKTQADVMWEDSKKGPPPAAPKTK